MFGIGVFFILALCLFALIATLMLGVKQTKQQNEKYDQSRKRTTILLSLIYLVAIILGAVFIFYSI